MIFLYLILLNKSIAYIEICKNVTYNLIIGIQLKNKYYQRRRLNSFDIFIIEEEVLSKYVMAKYQGFIGHKRGG